MEDYTMKKTISKILTFAFVLTLALSLTACGGNSTPSGGDSTPGTSSTAGNDTAAKDWPDNAFTAGLPKPSGKIVNVTVSDTSTSVYLDWTLEEARAYGGSLTAAGVPGEETDSGTAYMFEQTYAQIEAGELWNGYTVSVLATGSADTAKEGSYRITIKKVS
jgi:hypothetical protein